MVCLPLWTKGVAFIWIYIRRFQIGIWHLSLGAEEIWLCHFPVSSGRNWNFLTWDAKPSWFESCLTSCAVHWIIQNTCSLLLPSTYDLSKCYSSCMEHSFSFPTSLPQLVKGSLPQLPKTEAWHYLLCEVSKMGHKMWHCNCCSIPHRLGALWGQVL